MRLRPFLLLLLILVLVALSFREPDGGAGQPLDWDIPQGHFYTQTGPGDGRGYGITDEGGVLFWTEFQRLGGVAALGYPMSRRFIWDGFVSQATQRVVLQWRPEVGQAYFVNVFDQMSKLGQDDWLLVVRQTPRPIVIDEAGKSWDEVVAGRLALLDSNPAIRDQYFSVVGDPVTMNGLPTSAVTDMGNNYTLRAQRIVIQQWKEDVPWAKAGQVTVALGGAIAAELGLLPAQALEPEGGPAVTPGPSTPVPTRTAQPVATPTPVTTPAPTATPGPGARLFMVPGSSTISVGDAVSLEVRAEGVVNLYGAQFELAFDATRLQVVDADPSTPGVQVELGPFLPDGQSFVVRNEVDNGVGKVEYAGTRLPPAPPVTGNTILARVTFRGLAAGTVSIIWRDFLLADTQGTAVPTVAEGAQIIVR